MSYIPYGQQDIVDDDVAAVAAVLRSDWLTQGPKVPEFERAVASRVGAAHAVSVNSATSALHVACLSLGLGRGDLLWTSPITFVASANCALFCGAEVDFVDIDPRSYNLSIDALTSKLVDAEAKGRLPKIVVPVHLTGQSCDMAAIHALSRKYGFRIVEDASHSIGARYLDRPVGDCRYSDIAVFSFHPVKIITTAEGGMATTNDLELARRMQLFRSHGTTRDPSMMRNPADGAWYYEQIVLGYNYRMTEMQGALGVTQIERLERYVARRHELANRYDALLRDLPLRIPWRDPSGYSAMHLYVIRVAANARRAIFDTMRAADIGVNVHYIPVHLQPYFRDLGFEPGAYAESERYYAEAISLPMFAALSERQQDRVVQVLTQATNQ